jgi:hypothetical protein
MINKQISVRYIIAKVLADNDMQEDTLRINDLIEWCAEGLMRIGAFLELDTIVTGKGGEPLLEVSNYMAALPSDFHSIIQVAISKDETGPFQAMRMASGSFDSSRGITIEDTDDDDDETTTYTTIAEKPFQTSFTNDLVYTLKPGYITTNQQDGYLMLSYRSIPLDEEGYPYIPDDPGFEDALYWYLTMKLLYPKWVLGKVRDAVYYNARMSWNYYSKQAFGNSMMPNLDMLESIKNTWTRLIPELGDHNNFYSTTGQAQNIYNQTRRRYATNNYFGL